MRDLFGFERQPQPASVNTPAFAPDKKLKIKLFWIGLFPKVLTVVILCTAFYLLQSYAEILNFNRQSDEFTSIYFYVSAICFVGLLLCIIWGLPYIFFPSPLPDSAAIEFMSAKLKTKDKNFLSYGAQLKNYKAHIFLCVFAILFTVIFCICGSLLKSERFNLTSFIVLIAISALLFAFSVLNYLTIKKLKKSWNENRVLIDAAAKPSIDKLNFKKQTYYDMRDKARTSSGKPEKTHAQYDKELFLKKWGTVILIAVALVATFLYQLVFNGPNSACDVKSSIEYFSPGDKLAYAYRIMGDPYDKREFEIQGVKNGTWTWCDSPVAQQISNKNRQLERLYENADDLSFDDFEKILELETEIANLEEQLLKNPCNYLYVSFERQNITEISLEKSNGDSSKTIEKLCYAFADSLDIPYYEYTENALTLKQGAFFKKTSYDINVKIYFTDGSVQIKTVGVNFDADKEFQEVVWKDTHGEHSFPLTIND